MAPAADRLRGYLTRSSDGSVLDEPATARMLATVLLRGLHCGATDADEVTGRCGLEMAGLVRLTSAAPPPDGQG